MKFIPVDVHPALRPYVEKEIDTYFAPTGSKFQKFKIDAEGRLGIDHVKTILIRAELNRKADEVRGNALTAVDPPPWLQR